MYKHQLANFDLQLFAEEEMVDAESLGFTEDDLKGFIPEEKPPVEESTSAEETTETTSETAPGGENEQPVAEDHSDNLKAALKEEREKRKALRAELDTLKSQFQQSQQQKPQTQPQTQQIDVMQQIKADARKRAIESLQIEGNPSDLMFSDPDKYEEFVSERARLEYEAVSGYREQQKTFNENLSFVNELRGMNDFPTVFQYAITELDEMPLKQAKKIQAAYEAVDKGTGKKDDFDTLRNYVAECQKKMTGTNTPADQQNRIQANSGGLDAKLAQAANLPKAQQLSGGKTSQMSWEEVERLAKAGKWDEIPKELLLKLDPSGELLK